MVTGLPFPVLFALCDQQAACLLARSAGWLVAAVRKWGDLRPDRCLTDWLTEEAGVFLLQ